VDRNIAPHVPVWDKSARADGTFSRADFVFDQQRNIYICPGGAELTSTGNIDSRPPSRLLAAAIRTRVAKNAQSIAQSRSCAVSVVRFDTCAKRTCRE
jgi:hypothetical protein